MNSLPPAALLLAFGAIACGVAQPVPGGAGAQHAARPGGVLNQRITIDPYDWDVSISGKSLGGQNGHNVASESLMGYRSGAGTGYNEAIMRPELAERWTVSADGKAFTFHLKKEVKWPNLPPVNGRDFTSADVKFSYEYHARLGAFADKKFGPSQYDYYYEGMEGVDTPDPHTVVVRFKNPFLPYLAYAAADYNYIAAREIVEQDGNLSKRILGTGPFQLDMAASQTGSRYVWKKNPAYHQSGKPYLDEVRFLTIKDDSTAYSAFQTKQIDSLTGDMTPRTAAEQKTKTPAAVLHESYMSSASWRWYVNTRRAPLDDPRIRKAMFLAIDRDEFLGTLGEGKGRLALEGVPPGLFSEEEVRQLLRFDPNEARRLLADAGYPTGIELEATFPGRAYGEQYVMGLELAQAQFKRAGITLNLKSEDKGDWSNKRKKGEYFLGLQQSASAESDIDSWLFGAMHSGSARNYNGVKDARLDEWLVAQRREVDQAKRRDLVRQIVRHMIDNAYTIPIGTLPEFELWQTYVKNYAPLELARGAPITEVWLDK